MKLVKDRMQNSGPSPMEALEPQMYRSTKRVRTPALLAEISHPRLFLHQGVTSYTFCLPGWSCDWVVIHFSFSTSRGDSQLLFMLGHLDYAQGVWGVCFSRTSSLLLLTLKFLSFLSRSQENFGIFRSTLAGLCRVTGPVKHF